MASSLRNKRCAAGGSPPRGPTATAARARARCSSAAAAAAPWASRFDASDASEDARAAARLPTPAWRASGGPVEGTPAGAVWGGAPPPPPAAPLAPGLVAGGCPGPGRGMAGSWKERVA